MKRRRCAEHLGRTLFTHDGRTTSGSALAWYNSSLPQRIVRPVIVRAER